MLRIQETRGRWGCWDTEGARGGRQGGCWDTEGARGGRQGEQETGNIV